MRVCTVTDPWDVEADVAVNGCLGSFGLEIHRRLLLDDAHLSRKIIGHAGEARKIAVCAVVVFRPSPRSNGILSKPREMVAVNGSSAVVPVDRNCV